MAKMQAIEISDRVDCSFEPGRRAHRVRGEDEIVAHFVLPIVGLPPTCPLDSQEPGFDVLIRSWRWDASISASAER